MLLSGCEAESNNSLGVITVYQEPPCEAMSGEAEISVKSGVRWTACSSESLFPFHARRRCPGTVSAVSTRGKSYTIKSLPDCVVHTREGQGHEVWIPSTATTAIFQLHTTCHTCAPEENTINYRVHLSRNVHVQSRDPALSLPLRSTRTQPSNLPSAASARSLQLSCATRGSISTSDKWIYSGRD
jgi:hypothetical protein